MDFAAVCIESKQSICNIYVYPKQRVYDKNIEQQDHDLTSFAFALVQSWFYVVWFIFMTACVSLDLQKQITNTYMAMYKGIPKNKGVNNNILCPERIYVRMQI